MMNRGRKNLVGHILHQVGIKCIKIPLLIHLPDNFDKVSLGEHVWEWDGESNRRGASPPFKLKEFLADSISGSC